MNPLEYMDSLTAAPAAPRTTSSPMQQSGGMSAADLMGLDELESHAQSVDLENRRREQVSQRLSRTIDEHVQRYNRGDTLGPLSDEEWNRTEQEIRQQYPEAPDLTPIRRQLESSRRFGVLTQAIRDMAGEGGMLDSNGNPTDDPWMAHRIRHPGLRHAPGGTAYQSPTQMIPDTASSPGTLTGGEREVGRRIPMTGIAFTVGEAEARVQAARRFDEGTATRADVNELAMATIEAINGRDLSMLQRTGDFLTHLPTYAAEYLLTRGTAAGVRAGATATVARVLGEQATARLASTATGRVAAATLPWLASGAVRAPSAFGSSYAMERHAPIRVGGQDSPSLEFDWEAQAGVPAAVGRSLVRTAIEGVAEQTSELAPAVVRWLRGTPAGQATMRGVTSITPDFVRRAVAGYTASRAAGAMRGMGIGDPVAESVEERISELGGWAILGDDAGALEDAMAGRWGEVGEQLGSEMLAFGLFGAGMRASTAGVNAALGPIRRANSPQFNAYVRAQMDIGVPRAEAEAAAMREFEQGAQEAEVNYREGGISETLASRDTSPAGNLTPITPEQRSGGFRFVGVEPSGRFHFELIGEQGNTDLRVEAASREEAERRIIDMGLGSPVRSTPVAPPAPAAPQTAEQSTARAEQQRQRNVSGIATEDVIGDQAVAEFDAAYGSTPAPSAAQATPPAEGGREQLAGAGFVRADDNAIFQTAKAAGLMPKLELTYVRGLSAQEAAEMTGIHIDTVSAVFRRFAQAEAAAKQKPVKAEKPHITQEAKDAWRFTLGGVSHVVQAANVNEAMKLAEKMFARPAAEVKPSDAAEAQAVVAEAKTPTNQQAFAPSPTLQTLPMADVGEVRPEGVLTQKEVIEGMKEIWKVEPNYKRMQIKQRAIIDKRGNVYVNKMWVGDAPAFMHEIAEKMDFRLDQLGRPIIGSDYQKARGRMTRQVQRGLEQFDYEYGVQGKSYLSRWKDGYAEIMRYLATDMMPQNLSREQQAALNWLDAAMPAEMKQNLELTKKLFQGVKLTQEDLFGSTRPKPMNIGNLLEKASDLRQSGEGFMAALIDYMQPVHNLERQFRKNNRALQAGLEPSTLMHHLKLIGEAPLALRMKEEGVAVVTQIPDANGVMRDHIRIIGQPYSYIFEPTDKYGREGSPWTQLDVDTAMHALHSESEGNAYRAYLDPTKLEFLRKHLAEYRKDPQFINDVKETMARLTANYNLTLDALVEMRLLEQQAADYMKAKRPDFISTIRVKQDKEAGVGKFMGLPLKMTHQRLGSGLEIVPAREAYLMRINHLARFIQEQQVRLSFDRIFQGAGMDEFVEEDKRPVEFNKVDEKAMEQMLKQIPGLALQTISDVITAMGNKALTYFTPTVRGKNGEMYYYVQGAPRLNPKTGKVEYKNVVWRIKESKKGLYELMTGQQGQGVRDFMNSWWSSYALLGLPQLTTATKAMAVKYNPAWPIANSFRDLPTMWMNRQGGTFAGDTAGAIEFLGRAHKFMFSMWYDAVKGKPKPLKDMKDEIIKFQLQHGGEMQKYVTFSGEGVERQVRREDIEAGRVKAVGAVEAGRLKIENFLHMADLTARAFSASELAFRAQEIRKSLAEAGYTEQEIERLKKLPQWQDTDPIPLHVSYEAMRRGAEVTTPFGKKGWLTRDFIDKVMPFFGARMAGTAKYFRRWRAAPGHMAVYHSAVMSATLLHWLAFRDEDWWDEAGDQHNRFYLFRAPWNNEGWLMGIPKSQGPETMISNATRMLMEAMRAKDPRFMETMRDAVGRLVPADSIFGSHAPTMGVYTNTDWRGKPIVPEHLRGSMAGSTSAGSPLGVARDLMTRPESRSVALNYQIPHLARSYTGALGNWAATGINAARQAVGAGDVRDLPIHTPTPLSALSRREGQASLQDFREERRLLTAERAMASENNVPFQNRQRLMVLERFNELMSESFNVQQTVRRESEDDLGLRVFQDNLALIALGREPRQNVFQNFQMAPQALKPALSQWLRRVREHAQRSLVIERGPQSDPVEFQERLRTHQDSVQAAREVLRMLSKRW